MDRTLIEVTLKGTEGDSRTYSVVSLYGQATSEIRKLSQVCLQLREKAYDQVPLRTQVLLNKWDQGCRKPKVRKCV